MSKSLQIILLSMTLLFMAGCSGTTSLVIESDFPDVVSEPRDIHSAIVFEESFANYIARPNADTDIAIGQSQVKLLTKAFEGLFTEVDVVTSRDNIPPGAELVIIPSVREVQLSTPNESYLNVYELWIKYNLDMETAAGVPIDSWFVPAYGKTSDSMLKSRRAAIESASIIALRDAGAKLLLDFYRIPSINGWLQQQQAASSP